MEVLIIQEQFLVTFLIFLLLEEIEIGESHVLLQLHLLYQVIIRFVLERLLTLPHLMRRELLILGLVLMDLLLLYKIQV